MGNHFFFYHKRHFFLDDDRHLHLYRLNLCLVDLHSLIFDSVSVGLDRYFFDYLYRHSSFHFNLDNLLLNNSSLHDPGDFNLFILLLFHNNSLFNRYLNRDFDFLNDYLRNWNFHNLKLDLFADDNLFHDLGNFNYLLNNPWYHNYLLYDFLNFYNSRNLHNLLYDPINELRLNFDDFPLNNNRHGFVNFYRLDYFLLCSDNLYVLNFHLLDFFREVRLRDSFDYWNLLGDIERHDFFDFDFFSS